VLAGFSRLNLSWLTVTRHRGRGRVSVGVRWRTIAFATFAARRAGDRLALMPLASIDLSDVVPDAVEQRVGILVPDGTDGPLDGVDVGQFPAQRIVCGINETPSWPRRRIFGRIMTLAANHRLPLRTSITLIAGRGGENQGLHYPDRGLTT
jgi:hypothetical protein